MLNVKKKSKINKIFYFQQKILINTKINFVDFIEFYENQFKNLDALI